MLGYDERLAVLLGASEASDRRDYDAETKFEAALDFSDHEGEFRFHAELCRRAGEHVVTHGADRIGSALRHTFGSVYQLWHDIDAVSLEQGRATILALVDLYRDCFARHLPAENYVIGSSGGDLGGACYMLWDMDSGLESIPMYREKGPHVDACFHVLEQALTLASEPCVVSALHGLGHIESSRPERVHAIIDRFMAERGATLPKHITEYAALARDGGVL